MRMTMAAWPAGQQSAACFKIIGSPVPAEPLPSSHGWIAAKVGCGRRFPRSGSAVLIVGPLARFLGRRRLVGRPAARLRLAPLEVFLERRREPLGPPGGLAGLACRHGRIFNAFPAPCLVGTKQEQSRPRSLRRLPAYGTFRAVRGPIGARSFSCRSSVVEHSLGKGEVVSSKI